MALRSLGSLVRGTMRARTCSSSLQGGAAGSAAHNFLVAQRNAVFHVDGPHGSAFAGSRSRALHTRRDVVAQRDRGAFAALSVAVFSLSVGIVYMTKDTDESDEAQEEDTPMLRSHRLLEELKRQRASYNKAVPYDEKAVVQEYMESDQAMRARFEEWMKEHGRTYKDEVEKARRFKIFESVARFVDASNADAVEEGRSVRFGLNEYSDWNKEERARLYGIPVRRDGGYLPMVMSYLAQQEIWHQVPSAKNKSFSLHANMKIEKGRETGARANTNDLRVSGSLFGDHALSHVE